MKEELTSSIRRRQQVHLIRHQIIRYWPLQERLALREQQEKLAQPEPLVLRERRGKLAQPELLAQEQQGSQARQEQLVQPASQEQLVQLG